MAGRSETRTFDALLSTTLASFQKQLVDNIFDDYPLLSFLNGKLGRAMGLKGGAGVKRLENGGESIVEELLYAINSTAGSYSDYELLDVTPQDGITNARYEWKQYSASISISGREERANNGEARILNLLASKVTPGRNVP